MACQYLYKKSPLLSLSALCILLTPLATLAQGAFDGFYAGLSVGGNQMQANMNTQNSAVYNNSSSIPDFFYKRDFFSASDADTYDSSLAGVVRLGYGKQLDIAPIYLGIELFGNIAQRDAKTNTAEEFLVYPNPVYLSVSSLNQTQLHVKLNNVEAGADFRPGILLTPQTLLYGRLGVAFNQLTLVAPEESSFSFFESATNTVSHEESDDVAGLRLGLGLEQRITPALSLVADYIYTDYGDITAHGSDFDLTNPDGTVSENALHIATTADVTTHTVLIGLNYYPGQRAETGQTANFDRTQFNNIYGGIKGGALFNNQKLDITTSAKFDWVNLDTTTTQSLQETEHLWDVKGIGEIFIGYGKNLFNSSLYGAVELFGNLSSRNLESSYQQSYADTNFFGADIPFNINTLNTTTQIKLNPLEWGLDFKLGWLFSENTLLYGRIGGALNEIETKSNNTFTYIDNYNGGSRIPVTFVSELNAEESESVIGLRLGLGLEQTVWEKLGVTLDYVFTDYGNVDMDSTADALGSLSNITSDGFTNDTGVSVYTHSVMIGLIYHL